MFKLVVLSAILAIAAARPGYLGHHVETPIVYAAAPVVHHEYVKVHEPVITKVGAYVESIPSAVSHQSQTVIHGKGHIVTPILAPAVKTYIAPISHSYVAAPVVKSYSSSHLYHGIDHYHHHH